MKNIGLYLRLSVEDDGDKEESNSITNQRFLLDDYIQSNVEFAEYERKEYCDDGYSGTNFNRPGITKLLDDIKQNKIQCVIVKDMSRFSRDYIELGTYLNQIFPFMGIRFIAVNDHYDSAKQKGNAIELDTAFQTLLYDLYSKDISEKTKTSFCNKCENGEYVFGQAPFGYEKNPEVKNTVRIKEEEAAIVRHIFELSAAGNSSVKVAKMLHEERIPTIALLRKPMSVSGTRKPVWSSLAVRKILTNRFYIGEMIYGKSIRESVGSSKAISLPRDEWKVIENHHEPLISIELFETVSYHKPKCSTKRKREKNPLVGKIFCGGCGYSLSYKPCTEKKSYRRFECRMHAQLQITDCCTCISGDILEELVLTMLNKELMYRGNLEKEKVQLREFQKEVIHKTSCKMKECKSEIKRLANSKDILYEEYAERKKTAEGYQKCIMDVEKNITDTKEQMGMYREQLSQMEQEYERHMDDMKKVIRFAHIETLTQEVVDTFIRKISVYSKKRVEIEWNFTDSFRNGQ